MKTILKITIFCTVAFFTACKPAQHIVYDVNKYQPASERINASLSIQIFEDIRQEFPDNQAQLTAKDNVAKINNDKSCVNAEKLYKTPVGQQLADMLAKYLNKKAYFTRVVVNQNNMADYYVTAKVKYFTGHQKYSNKAAVGAQFGLVGALATMNLKTEGKIIIELAEIFVYDKAGNLVAQVGEFKKEYDGDFPVDANCYCIYRNVNQSLAELYEELGTILFQEVKKSL